MSFLFLWLGVMFPLVFSPGPANIVFAASGSSVGVKRSLPLMFGIDSIFILKSILIGFGFGSVINQYPTLLHILQFMGAGYIVYLAVCFLKSGLQKKAHQSRVLGRAGAYFKNGCFIDKTGIST